MRSIALVLAVSLASDLLGQGPVLLEDLVAGTTLIPSAANAVDLVSLGGSKAVFRVADGMWATDGATASKIHDVSPASASNPLDWNRIAFSGTYSGDTELWVTDGTTSGTSLLKNLHATGSSVPRMFTQVEWLVGTTTYSYTFFVAGTPNDDVWMTDRTATGTKAVTALSGETVLAIATSVESSRLTVWYLTGTTLFKTILSTPGGTWSTPRQVTGTEAHAPIATVGTSVYFVGNDSTYGKELWRATVSGSVGRLTDLVPGSGSASPDRFWVTQVGTAASLLFQATGPAGSELYRAQDTSVQLVSDVNPGPSDSFPQVLGESRGFVYFRAVTAQFGAELWRTDLRAYTTLVHDANQGTAHGSPTEALVTSNDRVYFAATHATKGQEVHVYQPNQATSVINLSPDGTSPSNPTQFVERPDGSVWFQAVVYQGFPVFSNQPALFRTDGTAAGTRMVRQGSFQYPFRQLMTFTDDWLGYFSWSTSGAGEELWQSDGTGSGTKQVTDLNPGSTDSSPHNLTVCGDKLFHAADDGMHGIELCERGKLCCDIRPGPLGSSPRELVRAGNFLFFTADDGVFGRELWAYQWRGKPGAKPYRVLDIQPGIGSSNPKSLINYRNIIYFIADDGQHGAELWRTDGSGSNTWMIKDINPGTGAGILGQLYCTNATLFFVGSEPTTGAEPWISNGTESGTRLVLDIRPGAQGSAPTEIVPIHSDRVACSADDGTNGRELWLVSVVGAKQFDLVPGPVGSDPRALFWSSDDLYFTATTAAAGREPWSAASIDLLQPAMIADIYPGPQGQSALTKFAIANKHVIFAADDGVHGMEPWVLPAGAVSRPAGQGCGGELRLPTLTCTAPHLGGNIQLNGWGVPSRSSTVTVFASTRPLVSIQLGLCQLQLDPNTLLPILAKAISGDYVVVVPIPNDPKLLGLDLRVASTVYPSTDPYLGFDVTNAVELRIGN
ncbi:MAG: hypothetical protein KDC87_14290 [Planctomycetes bacterium]|nr:hypothetical protein [Planctomycetota bacterium]